MRHSRDTRLDSLYSFGSGLVSVRCAPLLWPLTTEPFLSHTRRSRYGTNFLMTWTVDTAASKPQGSEEKLAPSKVQLYMQVTSPPRVVNSEY
jgi:hypothetical protein